MTASAICRKGKTFLAAWFLKTVYRTAYKFSSLSGCRMPAFLTDVKEANWIAADYFIPKSYDGHVVLFRCQSRLTTDPPDSSRIWKRLVTGTVKIIDLPGDHNSMLREPNVGVLADLIQTYLKPANATPAAPTPAPAEISVA